MNTEFFVKHANGVKDYMLDWRNWLRGLFGAAIGGAASSVTVIVVAPETFNLQEGLKKLCYVAGISAIYHAALFLKTNPIPNEKDTDSNPGTPDTV